MTNGNESESRNQLASIMKGMKEVMLDALEAEHPGAKQVTLDVESETIQLIESYEELCLTELHALRLMEKICSDLERSEMPMITKLRSMVLDIYNIVFYNLLQNEENLQRWHRREELKEEIRDGVQHKQTDGS